MKTKEKTIKTTKDEENLVSLFDSEELKKIGMDGYDYYKEDDSTREG